MILAITFVVIGVCTQEASLKSAVWTAVNVWNYNVDFEVFRVVGECDGGRTSRVAEAPIYPYLDLTFPLYYPEPLAGNVLVDQSLKRNWGLLVRVILHALGHVLGLPHDEDDTSIMYPFVSDSLWVSRKDVEKVKEIINGSGIYRR